MLAAGYTPVYDLVDVSKKRDPHERPIMTSSTADLDSPVYSTAEKTVDILEKNQAINSHYSMIPLDKLVVNSQYSPLRTLPVPEDEAITLDNNMYSTVEKASPDRATTKIHGPSTTTNKVSAKLPKKKMMQKILACILVTIAAMAITTFVCCAVIFPKSQNQVHHSNESEFNDSNDSNDSLPSSCASLYQSLSGYYWLRDSNGSAVRVYCNTTWSCGNVSTNQTRGWMRVAELDMTNSSHQCPSSLVQRIDSNKRTCGLRETPLPRTCSSVTFSSAAVEYSRVCGKIIAIQRGTPHTFRNKSLLADINANYLDGVSLTYGNPRQHLWTFAAGLDETIIAPQYNCPCTNIITALMANTPPAFVGRDYFCDTGSHNRSIPGRFYGDDPLWDGAGCGPYNHCCSFNNPPWFYKQLPQPTTDNIEMRVCRDHGHDTEDILIQEVTIFVQ